LLQQAIDQRGLAVVDVGDDGDVTKVHGSSSGRAKVDARSRRKTGIHFSGSRSKTWNSMGRISPKRKPGQKDRAHLTRCGAIYSENAKKQWFVWHLVSRF
jgi:hypothetical protein